MPHRIALNIPTDHPAYPGHFPGAPILPGVVLVDAALHAVAMLGGSPAMRWRIVTTKFHQMVRPGEPLMLEHESLPNGTIRFAINTTSGGTASVVASGVLESLIPTDEPGDAPRTR